MPSPHTQSSGEERRQNHNSNIKQRRNPAKVKLKRGGTQKSIVIIITNLFLLPRLQEGKIGDSHLQELCISYMGSSNFRLVF